MERTGKLIVIEGGDGAGKATQTDLLVHRLVQEGVATGTLDFPRFKANTYGALIRESLDGKHGDFLDLDPKIAATLFAADRFESRKILDGWIEEGRNIILDRYVSASMVHQGAKIKDDAQRAEFYKWLEHVEHDVFGMPKPDFTVYLRVPTIERLKLLEHAVRKRENIIDVAESNPSHQDDAERVADLLAEARPDWYVIECMKEGELRDKEDIHEELYQLVREQLN